MTTPIYPKSLPGVTSVNRTPVSNVISDSDDGVQASRRRSRVPSSFDTLEFLFAETDLSIFRDFVKTTLLGSHKWFWIELPSAGAITWHKVRFVSKPVFSEKGFRFRSVTCKVEISERAFEEMISPRVSLLIHGNVKIYDSSINYKKEILTTGSISVSDDESKFQQSSVYFPGAIDYLHVDSSEFTFADDFTFESFTFSKSTSTSTDPNGLGVRCIFDTRLSTANVTGCFFRENGGGFLFGKASTAIIQTTVGRIPNQWQHTVIERKDGEIRLTIDEKILGYAYDNQSFTDSNLRIGSFINTDEYAHGYYGHMNETRIYSTDCVYKLQSKSPTKPFPGADYYANL
ncbi:MAG: hypothetical protein V4493_01350 [Pseudomonadota bacterium]